MSHQLPSSTMFFCHQGNFLCRTFLPYILAATSIQFWNGITTTLERYNGMRLDLILVVQSLWVDQDESFLSLETMSCRATVWSGPNHGMQEPRSLNVPLLTLVFRLLLRPPLSRVPQKRCNNSSPPSRIVILRCQNCSIVVYQVDIAPRVQAVVVKRRGGSNIDGVCLARRTTRTAVVVEKCPEAGSVNVEVRGPGNYLEPCHAALL